MAVNAPHIHSGLAQLNQDFFRSTSRKDVFFPSDSLASLGRRNKSNMDGFDLLVINGLVVTASDTANYDIAIKDGKIALLAPPGVLSTKSAKKVIDAEGGYVMVWSNMGES